MTQELDITVPNRSKLSLVHLSPVYLISNSTQLSSQGTCSSPPTVLVTVTSEITELLG